MKYQVKGNILFPSGFHCTFQYRIIALVIGAMLSCSDNDELRDPLVDKYKNVTVIDVHNHDASGYRYNSSVTTWNNYSIDRVVLFGDISEPSAIETDAIAWDAYQESPSRYIPFFAGFDINDASCLEVARENFETGFFGIGEFVAASTYSPVTANLPWKGEHPMDGYFPEIYRLCSEFNAPILLHIDPPFGLPVEKLEEALDSFPNTIFIFGHANAYNTPVNLEGLLSRHDNIYMDFYAGFTRYNPESNYSLEDFVPVILQYPERILVSSDSGFDLGYDKAYMAIYELFELLDSATIERVAHANFEDILARRK